MFTALFSYLYFTRSLQRSNVNIEPQFVGLAWCYNPEKFQIYIYHLLYYDHSLHLSMVQSNLQWSSWNGTRSQFQYYKFHDFLTHKDDRATYSGSSLYFVAVISFSSNSAASSFAAKCNGDAGKLIYKTKKNRSLAARKVIKLGLLCWPLRWSFWQNKITHLRFCNAIIMEN